MRNFMEMTRNEDYCKHDIGEVFDYFYGIWCLTEEDNNNLIEFLGMTEYQYDLFSHVSVDEFIKKYFGVEE